LIFKIELELFSIGTITILNKIVSLFIVGVSKIRINEEFEPEQGTSYQIAIEMVPSTTKSKEFYVRPLISLENKVYPKTHHHHTQDDIEVDETVV
jgi:hypothetical protein